MDTPSQDSKDPQQSTDPKDLQDRVTRLERHLRNLRMAVIIVVAFFVYEALMPPELRPGKGEKIHSVLKTEELVLTTRSNDVFARLLIDEDGGRLNLLSGKGQQIEITPDAVRLVIERNGKNFDRLRITPDDITLYGAQGNTIQRIPIE